MGRLSWMTRGPVTPPRLAPPPSAWQRGGQLPARAAGPAPTLPRLRQLAGRRCGCGWPALRPRAAAAAPAAGGGAAEVGDPGGRGAHCRGAACGRRKCGRRGRALRDGLQVDRPGRRDTANRIFVMTAL